MQYGFTFSTSEFNTVIVIQLDPDAENALERFRIAQSVVRRNKERLDGLKLDTLQKVDLLAASRCNLFSQVIIIFDLHFSVIFFDKFYFFPKISIFNFKYS